jgi:hypothetical protein
MTPSSHSKRPVLLLLLVFCGSFSLLTAAPCRSQTSPTTSPTSLNQHRINELAAVCVDVQLVFKGLKGSPKPGETPSQFSTRIKGYFDALDRAVRELAPLRQTLTPHDIQPENTVRWKKISDVARRIPQEVQSARLAWKQVPQLREKAQLGQKLLAALDSLQSLLTALRDARP